MGWEVWKGRDKAEGWKGGREGIRRKVGRVEGIRRKVEGKWRRRVGTEGGRDRWGWEGWKG